jgi:hypothetical protein
MYASDDIGEVKVTRGSKHDNLAMILDFIIPGKLKIDVRNYISQMVNRSVKMRVDRKFVQS